MDTYVKLFTGPTFKNADFAALLQYTDIDAAPVDDGVILNYGKFMEIPAAALPHWVYLNRDDINSKLHTRPATMRELRDAQSAIDGIELIGAYAETAFSGLEFGCNGYEMFARYVYDDYVGEWEEIDDCDIADDGCTTIYHVKGIDVSEADIMRVGA